MAYAIIGSLFAATLLTLLAFLPFTSLGST